MRIFQICWCVALFILFLIGSTWYGGNGKPLSSDEGNALIEKLRQAYPDSSPNPGNFRSNMEDMIPNDDGKEFYAVNLEQLKEGEEATKADLAYTRTVFPLLLKRAGHPIFVSETAGLMLGEYGGKVDRVIVVRYRSLKDLIEMAFEPSMIANSGQKFASLDHTEVFITRPRFSFVTIRWVFGSILLLLGIVGWKLLGYLSLNRRR